MQITEQQKRKMLAAAEIVDAGDMAVLQKILEFQDFLEENNIKLSEFFAKIEADVLDYKQNTKHEMSSEMEVMTTHISEMKDYCQEMEAKMERGHEIMMKDMGEEMKSLKERIVSLLGEIEKVRGEIPEMPPQTDLTDIYNRLVEIENKIPKIPDEITSYQVRDKLEKIDNESEKLSINAIENLRKELDDLKKKWTSRPMFGGGGFNAGALNFHLVDDETPTGAINDVNKDFIISHTPSPTSSLKVYLNGQRMRITEDYTFSGVTISFTNAPLTGSILLVDFRI